MSLDAWNQLFSWAAVAFAILAAISSGLGVMTRNRISLRQRLVDEYSVVAKWDAVGLSGIVTPGGPLQEHSAINDLIGPYITLGPEPQIKCTAEAIDAYNAVIKRFDKFPFAYYYRAMCERANKQIGWKEDFEKARTILRITTQVPGHHLNHDQVLNAINSLPPA